MKAQSHFETRQTCPGCGAKEANIIYTKPYDDPQITSYLHDFYSKQGHIDLSDLQNANYALEECKSCGLIYQKEIPNNSLMEKLYEHWISPVRVFEEEQKSFTIDYYARNAQEVGALISYFGVVPTTLKFFDFGMGWGYWLRMVSAFGVQAYGAELSTSRINYAKRFGTEIIDWEQMGQFQFDLINAEQVFEHIPQPLETLIHLKRALKPGGLIKISVPDGTDTKRRISKGDWSASKGTRNSLNAVSPLEHINCFNYNSLLMMADKAGLKRVVIPLKSQYSFMVNNSSLKRLVFNFLRPLVRNYFKTTYLFFTYK